MSFGTCVKRERYTDKESSRMIAAIVLGVILGVLAFIPLMIGLRVSRKVTRTSNFGHASILLLAVFGSLAVLVVSIVICITWMRDLVLPFVVAEALALSVAAIAFGIYTTVRK